MSKNSYITSDQDINEIWLLIEEHCREENIEPMVVIANLCYEPNFDVLGKLVCVGMSLKCSLT